MKIEIVQPAITTQFGQRPQDWQSRFTALCNIVILTYLLT